MHGAVPKWLRERSAKPLCSGSNPLGALFFFAWLATHPARRARPQGGSAQGAGTNPEVTNKSNKIYSFKI